MSISELFEGMIARPAQQTQQAQIDPALQLAQLVGKPGAFAAYYGGQRNQAMANAGRNISDAMSGGQYSSGAKITPDQLPGLMAGKMTDLLKGDTTNPEVQSQILQIAKVSNPELAVKLAAEFGEQNKVAGQAEAVARLADDAGDSTTAGLIRSGIYNDNLSAGTTALTAEARSLVKYRIAQTAIAERNARTSAGQAQTQAARLGLDREQALVNNELNRARVDAEIARIALERDKFIRDPLPTAAEQSWMLTTSDEAEDMSSMAYQMIGLANQYIYNPPPSGARGMTEEAFNLWLGRTTDADMARTAYRNVRNQFTLSNLPPGAASDNDVKIAMQGWPTDFSDPKKIASFVSGQAKLAALASVKKRMKVSFLQDTGSPANFEEHWQASGEEVMSKLALSYPDLVFTDSGTSGSEDLQELQTLREEQRGGR
jgi:hypothetical protein